MMQPTQSSTSPTQATQRVDDSQPAAKALPTNPFIAGLMEDALTREVQHSLDKFKEERFDILEKPLKDFDVKRWPPLSARFVVTERLRESSKAKTLLATLVYNLGRFTHLLLSFCGLPFVPKCNLAYYLDRTNLQKYTSTDSLENLAKAHLQIEACAVAAKGIEQKLLEFRTLATRQQAPLAQISSALPKLLKRCALEENLEESGLDQLLSDCFQSANLKVDEMKLLLLDLGMIDACLAGDSTHLLELAYSSREVRDPSFQHDPINDDRVRKAKKEDTVRKNGIKCWIGFKFALEKLASQRIADEEAEEQILNTLAHDLSIANLSDWIGGHGELGDLLRLLKKIHTEIKDSLYAGNREELEALAKKYKEQNDIDISGFIKKAMEEPKNRA